MKNLDLRSFPLEGIALIEASAGTGKTYALANLYLRYLLEKHYAVDQVLVVTFTEAATQELKDRIRKRIQEQKQVFEGALTDDPLLQQLYEQSSEPEADLIRLRLAEREMDQAEIFTIHGFCQRLLQKHAVSLGRPLEQSLSEDLMPLWREACQLFWRQHVVEQSEELACYLLDQWGGPDNLLLSLSALLQRNPQVIEPAIKTSESDPYGLNSWVEAHAQTKKWFAELRSRTESAFGDVMSLLESCDLKRKNDKLRWLDLIRQWSSSERGTAFPATSSKPNLLQEFTPFALAGHVKKGAEVPEHPWFDFLAAHLQVQPADLQTQFLHCAYLFVSKEVALLKEKRSLQGFDDLILDVARVFQPGESHLSEQGIMQLVAQLREQYQVALIDEFQDTDPSQYQIFKALFMSQGTGSHPEPSLVLIGDPKQAIYAFRGGDIATYLKAKSDIAAHAQGEIFTMGTNWRSSPAMVQAVNDLFGRLEQPFGHPDIPFTAVAAAKPEPDFEWGSALRLCYVPSAGKKKPEFENQLAHYCAGRISDLLHDPSSGIRSADIAVLVRTGAQADLFKSVLSEYGVRASFEGRSSIYESEEAMSILWLMIAAAEPEQLSLVRRCLAQPFFAISDLALGEYFSEAAGTERLLAIFKRLHQVWQHSGILSMIRMAFTLLDSFQAWHDSLLEKGALERRLTNINQLAELLQGQSRQVSGMQALIRWLKGRINRDESLNDENRVRLESDEKLVQIVTIHRSKGLEYPVVFLPFMHSARAAQSAWFYDELGQRCVDLENSEERLASAERERLDEDMRLLYVALTRAKYRCYVGFSDYKGRSGAPGLWQSAWGQLLACRDSSASWESLKPQLEVLGEQISLVDVESETESTKDKKLELNALIEGERGSQTSGLVREKAAASDEATSDESSRIQARVLGRSIEHAWRVQSFTGLLQEHDRMTAGTSLPSLRQSDQPGLFDALVHELETKPSTASAKIDIYDFPKGSRAGTFLHELFEAVSFESAELHERLSPRYTGLAEWVSVHLARTGLIAEESLNQWTEFLLAWLPRTLKADLGSGLRLSSLQDRDYIAELDFHFSAESVDSSSLNRVLKEHGRALSDLGFGDSNEPLSDIVFERFHGHLKGAIDLVFRHQEQYFILDYKSNYLGNSPEDYLGGPLIQAMLDHRYDLQYLVYVLALHRHLQHRLGDDYSYERDFGGVYYLFLRGLNLSSEDHDDQYLSRGSDARHGVYFCKPSWSVIQHLDQVFGGPGC